MSDEAQRQRGDGRGGPRGGGRRGGRGPGKGRGGPGTGPGQGASGEASRPKSVEERAVQAVRALKALVRAVAIEQGTAPGQGLPIDALALAMKVPFELSRKDRDPARDRQEGVALAARVRHELGEAMRGIGAFRMGRVYCFHTEESDGPRTVPGHVDETFAGYSPSGLPQWVSFANLCIQRREERVDRLYGDRPEVLALVQLSGELAQGLLPGFERGSRAFHVHGQVVAGLLPRDLGPRPRAGHDRFCLTMQIVETRGSDGGRQLRLNVLGLEADELAALAAEDGGRGPAEALRRTLAELRRKLGTLGGQLSRADGVTVTPPTRDEVAAKVVPMLHRLRGDVERIWRAGHRRTGHANVRHRDGERPTGHALQDARRASDESLYRDRRTDAVVVVGKNGRAHVFNAHGHHVTSLRLEPGELVRKTSQKRWTPLEPEARAQFRAAVDPG